MACTQQNARRATTSIGADPVLGAVNQFVSAVERQDLPRVVLPHGPRRLEQHACEH
jgi:hypothetical protein